MRDGVGQNLEILGVDGEPLRLEELIDKLALRELVASWAQTFGVPVRIRSATGVLLAGSLDPSPLATALASHPGATNVVRDAATEPLAADGLPRTVDTFTGELYRVVPIAYDRQPIGRIVVGPFTLPGASPAVLLAALPGLDPELAETAWSRLSRIDAPRAEEIGVHLATVLEVMLFSGHKALLTSQMHLASMRESYRELSEKNERLAEAYERLKELDRLKSNFLATVSHELRTPLTSIMGYGEMLAEGVAGALNREQHEFIETIRTKSDQLLGLIMSLLDLSKLESGTMQVRVLPIAIGSVLEEAVSTILPAALKKAVAIELDIPPVLPSILGDADRLRQVFINLTDNAVKFTPPDGYVRIVARVTMAQLTGEPGIVLVAPLRPVIEVRVSDTGIGIDEEERQKVFDPFYQIDQSSTREFGGAGLGLAIVKRLVEAHQGTIHIESNQPSGAVFVVALPAVRTTSLLPPSAPSSTRDPLPSILGQDL